MNRFDTSRVVIATLTLAVGALLLGAPQPVRASDSVPSVLFVVDTSGSMGGSRIQQAKEALTASVDALAADQAAGLRSYAGSCGDGGDLRTAIGVGNRDELRSQIGLLAAGGGTPTPDALRAAEQDLDAVSGPRAIVLISDGQSGCGDPCPVAAQISARAGIEFKVHTVGFHTNSQAEDELACIADATGGQYFSVDDADSLAGAIGDIVGTDPDRDKDGLLNVWETNGVVNDDGDIDVDLPGLGADPDVRDIFIEVDWMEDPGFCFIGWCPFRKSFRPTNSQMEVVYEAFENAPYENDEDKVHVHIDSGPESQNADGSSWGESSGGNSFDHTPQLLVGDYLYNGYLGDRAANLTTDRDKIFLHAIIADGFVDKTGESIGGRAIDIPGNAFVVSQGQPSEKSDTEIGGTFLHELGHTLGLRHGGGDNIHFKPNYVSSMNYLFQNVGLPGGKKADYSGTVLDSLDESSLDERAGLPYASSFMCAPSNTALKDGSWKSIEPHTPVDWNCNGEEEGTVEASVAAEDLDVDDVIGILDGHNDWANLRVGDGVSDYAARGFVLNNSVDEIPLEDVPFNTDDAVELNGLRDLVVDADADLPVLPYTVRNAGDDADVFTVAVTGSASATKTLTVGPLMAGESVVVPVRVTGAGLVELLVTSGNDPSVASSTDTIVRIADVATLDPADVLRAVASHLEELGGEPALSTGEKARLLRGATDVRAAVNALTGSRPTWDAKTATLAIERAAARMKGGTGNAEINDAVDVLLGVLANASEGIAEDAVDLAGAEGGSTKRVAESRRELAEGRAHEEAKSWFAAMNAFKRAAAFAYSAYRT